MRITDRPTGDLVLLLFAATIAAVILGSLGATLYIEIRDPAVDTSGTLAAITGVINTLLGLAAGYLIRSARDNGRNGP